MEDLIERFYAAFARKDGDAMAACYAQGTRFSDPAFGELRGEEPGAMWRMLTAGARDLSVELRAAVRRRARADLQRFMAATSAAGGGIGAGAH